MAYVPHMTLNYTVYDVPITGLGIVSPSEKNLFMSERFLGIIFRQFSVNNID